MRANIRPAIAILAATALGAMLAVSTVLPTSANPWRSSSSSSLYTDEIKDYGVCRGLNPKCYNDWGNGFADGEEKRILIYSGTAGPRHAHLGDPLGPGLNPPLNESNVAQQALIAWAAEAGVQADWTEDLAGSRARLGNYQAFVNLSGNRDTFDDTEQTSILQYVRGGGGFVGIHNAFGAEYHWEWYEGLLGGTNFYDHGRHQDAIVETESRRDVSTRNLPRRWAFKDEWYNLVPYPSYVRVLAEVDERTMLIPKTSGHPGHRWEHPVSWCHYYDGGRAWLTTLGHDVAAWNDEPLPGDDLFKEHVVQGLLSAMGVQPFCR
jgi:hypothetical protein